MKGHPFECVADTFGLSGIVPASLRLGESLSARFEHREDDVMRWLERFMAQQEKVLHCWSATKGQQLWRRGSKGKSAKPRVNYER